MESKIDEFKEYPADADNETKQKIDKDNKSIHHSNIKKQIIRNSILGT